MTDGKKNYTFYGTDIYFLLDLTSAKIWGVGRFGDGDQTSAHGLLICSCATVGGAGRCGVKERPWNLM